MKNIIKGQLQKSKWFVTCENREEYNNLMKLCDSANLVWTSGRDCMDKCFFEANDFPVHIGVNKDYELGYQPTLLYSKNKKFLLSEGLEDLTDLVFKD